MMSQTHIGYTYWQQPERQTIPAVFYVNADSAISKKESVTTDLIKAKIPAGIAGNVFQQVEKSGISIEADHYTRAINTDKIKWQILPDLGRTGSAISTFPVISAGQKPLLEYEVYTYSKGDFSINTYHSPTLNFQNTEEGLQYAISVDDETPQIISINKDYKVTSTWYKWVAENIIIKSSRHRIDKPGKHVVKYWMVSPGVILQKLVLDFGDTEQSYLGPPETIYITDQK
jgi:hypothetical protein